MKTMNGLKILGWLIGLALLVSACSSPALAGQASQPSKVPPTPAQTATAPSQPAGNRYNYEGVAFSIDPAVATGASGQTLPENPGSADGPYWDVNPRYIRIALEDYPITQNVLQPGVSVYPVDDYRRLSPVAGKTLDELKNMLAQKPTEAMRMPFLPVVNAEQVFHSNVQYLHFQNGSGVRYLAIYAQYPAPVNNQDLFYTYQGLTTDGKYFISIILPANHPSLPANSQALTNSEMEKNAKDPGYYPGETAKLAAQPGSSFTPNLAKLDALIASLAVDPVSLSK